MRTRSTVRTTGNCRCAFQVTLENGDNVVDFIRMPVEHIEQGITVASQDQPKINSKEKGGKQQPQLPMVVGSPAKMP